jgi:hypothetical protein
MVYMQQGGRYVTSNESKTLQESMLKMELHEYLKKLHEWEDETSKTICWESFEQARKRSNNNMIRFTTKLTTLWLPVGVNELRQGTRCADTCPLCKQKETIQHLYQCKQRQNWQKTLLEELHKMLQDAATEGALQQEIIQGLQNWFEGKEAIPSTQTKIGWFRLLLGYINRPWIARQERHYRDIQMNDRKCNGTIWGRKLILWMWTQAHIVWKHRCEALHGHEGPSLKVQENLTAKVKELYKQRDKLRASDRTILDRPIEEVLEMTQSNMKAFIEQVAPIVALAIRDAVMYDRTTTQNLPQMMKNQRTNKCMTQERQQ